MDEAELLERARRIAAPFVGPDHIGTFVTGSLVYPGTADPGSDVDVVVVFDDSERDARPPERRHHPIIDRGPPRRKLADLLLEGWSELAAERASAGDGRRWRARFALVADDPSGRLAAMLAEIADLPENVAVARMKLHYLETRFCRDKVRRARDRGDRANAHVMNALGAHAAFKVLALERRTWPPYAHWMTQGLLHAGVPREAIDGVADALANPDGDGLGEVLAILERRLEAGGLEFHRNLIALDGWYWGAEGREVSARWGLGVS